MAGRGRGRGLIPEVEVEGTRVCGRGRGRKIKTDQGKQYLNFIIDDLIKTGKGKSMPIEEALYMSLDDIILAQKNVRSSAEETRRQHCQISTRMDRKDVESKSLDDIIQTERNRDQTRDSLDDVDCGPPKRNNYTIESQGTLGALSTRGRGRQFSQDAFKSLDAIVSERGILTPSKYKRRDDGGLPITGKNVTFSSDINKTSVTGGKLDPMANSLDAIISDRGIDEDVGANNTSRTKRSRNREEVDGDLVQGKRTRLSGNFKYVLTPYRAVSFLREKGMIVNLRIGKKVINTDEDKNPPRKWRCIVECGSIKGIAESARKTISREIACDQFMKNLKTEYPDGKIPHYEIPDEIFLDPKVCQSVKTLCEELGKSCITECRIDGKTFEESNECQSVFEAVCYVENDKFIGRNTDRTFAEVIAASEAFKSLTFDECPRTVYFVDNECDKSVEYHYAESEVYQCVEQIDTKKAPSLK